MLHAVYVLDLSTIFFAFIVQLTRERWQDKGGETDGEWHAANVPSRAQGGTRRAARPLGEDFNKRVNFASQVKKNAILHKETASRELINFNQMPQSFSGVPVER